MWRALLVGLGAALFSASGCSAGAAPPGRTAENAPVSPSRDASEAADFMFPVGTTWIYSFRKDGKHTARLTAEVTRSEKGRYYRLLRMAGDSDKAPVEAHQVSWIQDNGLCRSAIDDGGLIDPTMNYRFGSKKGDTWEDSGREVTATHEGRVEVKVPAGTYKDAIQIKVTSDADGRLITRYWLVPKVDMVRLIAGPVTMELEKFEGAETND